MFTKMIEEMLDTGLTETEIGQRVDASQATINRIKRDKQNPQYELGAALVRLHQQIVIDARAVQEKAAA